MTKTGWLIENSKPSVDDHLREDVRGGHRDHVDGERDQREDQPATGAPPSQPATGAVAGCLHLTDELDRFASTSLQPPSWVRLNGTTILR